MKSTVAPSVDSLRAALQTGVAQLDNGEFIEGTPKELSRALRAAHTFGDAMDFVRHLPNEDDSASNG
jgi:hypothetical protein